jgi:hypothetical protein
MLLVHQKVTGQNLRSCVKDDDRRTRRRGKGAGTDVKFETLEEQKQQVLRFIIAIMHKPASESRARSDGCGVEHDGAPFVESRHSGAVPDDVRLAGPHVRYGVAASSAKCPCCSCC